MKRRSLLKGIAALPAVTSLSKFLAWANPAKKLGKVAISAKPETIVMDSDYPEASIDLTTGKLYIEVSDAELLNKEFLPTFEERIKGGTMSTYWLSAKKDGYCAECETEIFEGQRIVYDNNTYKAYCSDCGEEVAGVDSTKRGYIK